MTWIAKRRILLFLPGTQPCSLSGGAPSPLANRVYFLSDVSLTKLAPCGEKEIHFSAIRLSELAMMV